MIIREMRNVDYPQLCALWKSFPGNAMTDADGPDGFERFLRHNAGHCFVAEEGGILTGSVMAGHDTRRGYVYHLAVERSCQRSGAGARLMETVEKSLLDAGIEKIHLFIYTDNPAREFYEKIGWTWRTDIGVMSKRLKAEEQRLKAEG
jgi:ribosomal protein S18 acetylase RimI-like enzyme